MAESNSTKLALASSLKKLTGKTPLDKISVTDICRECGVNRKSFYYHFQDKYDLVNWIFDSEFDSIAGQRDGSDGLRALLRLLEYLYENRSFYRRALNVRGQNSFADHFRDRLTASVRSGLRLGSLSETMEFRINFFADAFICAIERWLMGRETMPPGKMYGMITACFADAENPRKALSEGLY